jgi:phosphodiester glycosidase
MRSLALFAVVAACAALILAALPACPAPLPVAQPGWRTLEPGLDVGEFEAPHPSPVGDSRITVVRIDPARFKLNLYSVIALKLPEALPIDAWTQQQRLAAVINAGMFGPDGRTTGYGRVGDVTLNPVWKPNYGAFLALAPDDPKLPAATILDAECDDVETMEKHYRVVLQSMRMIDCKGANRWQKSPRIWSTAALAIDDRGRVLFIHARSPWDVHDLIEILLAMYLEGGPEASLSLATVDLSIVLVGSWETGFNENDGNVKPWPLPNVIGARRMGSGDP